VNYRAWLFPFKAFVDMVASLMEMNSDFSITYSKKASFGSNLTSADSSFAAFRVTCRVAIANPVAENWTVGLPAWRSDKE
jgi:hypothetical protein